MLVSGREPEVDGVSGPTAEGAQLRACSVALDLQPVQDVLLHEQVVRALRAVCRTVAHAG